MGFSSERHDLMSQETHAGKWIGFRQPVLRVLQEREGKKVEYTYQANPGEVWEEDEFWINLSWAIDPTVPWAFEVVRIPVPARPEDHRG